MMKAKKEKPLPLPPLPNPPAIQPMRLDSVSCQICMAILMRIAGGDTPCKLILVKPHIVGALRREPAFSVIVDASWSQGTLAGIPIVSDQTIKTDVELR